jgi:hypothetical protein
VRGVEGALLFALLGGAALPVRELLVGSSAVVPVPEPVLSAACVRKNVPELGAAAAVVTVLCLREGRMPPVPGAPPGARGEMGGGCEGVSCIRERSAG